MRRRSGRAGAWGVLLTLALLVGARAQPPQLNPNQTEFPDSSLADLSAPPYDPALGFLSTNEAGHFVWEDGTRARFWGVNVAAESVFQPVERIEEAIQAIKRAGFNLLRIHHVDGTDRGIIASDGDNLVWDQDKLRQLDYWVDRAGQLGLSVYLDLLDYRDFPGAAELGRAAKPYAVFDQHLIDLQKQYAKAFLRDHRNQFNGRAYADDPTVVLLELYDENGLFIRRTDWPGLVQPYRGQLAARWNAWLLERYGSSAALSAAWARSGVAQPLPAGQRLESGSVALPNLAKPRDERPMTAAARLEQARQADLVRFAADVHRAYFAQMRDYLRDELGVRVPLSAVGDFGHVADLAATADELDFIGTNFYWDHPTFRAGRDWQLPFLFRHADPLSETSIYTFAQVLATARMQGKPLVVREWNYCAPNPHRAGGMVEATAYSALQDVDAMILFTYGLRPRPNAVGWFDSQADPVRWGLAGVLGAAWLRGAIQPALNRIDLGFGELDVALARDHATEVRNLAWVARLGNRVFDEQLAADAELTIASGRSGAAKYSGGPLLLVRRDPAGHAGGEPAGGEGFLGYPVGARWGGAASFAFDGQVLAAAGNERWAAGWRFPLAALTAAGAEPIGRAGADALGFWDPKRRVAGFGDLSPAQTTRVALDLLGRVHGAPVSRADQVTSRYVADTGQIVRDSRAGRVTVDTATFAAIGGALPRGGAPLGGLELEQSNPRGAVVALSLDGRALADSERFVVRSVSQAVNSHMDISPPGPLNNPRNMTIVGAEGSRPVLTGGRTQAGAWRLRRGGQVLVTVDQVDGSLELLREPDGWLVWTDTLGVSVDVPGAEAAWAVAADGTERPLTRGASGWVYPAGAVLMRAR